MDNKNEMKKWTYAILALTLTAGLAACNGSNDETDNNIVFGAWC